MPSGKSHSRACYHHPATVIACHQASLLVTLRVAFCAGGTALHHLLYRQPKHNCVPTTIVMTCSARTVWCSCLQVPILSKGGLLMQVLRCQPENGAVNVDQLPVALTRPRHEGHVSRLEPSALSRHLGTQDLQAPKVSTAGSVTLSLHHTFLALLSCALWVCLSVSCRVRIARRFGEHDCVDASVLVVDSQLLLYIT